MKTWCYRAGAALVIVSLSMGVGHPPAAGGALAAGQSPSSHRTVHATVAAHLSSWHALPAGLAPALRRALAGAAPLHGADMKPAATTPMSGTTWSQQAEMQPPSGSTGDEFGYSVAVSGTTAVVGARTENRAAGAAYVFVRSGTTWTQQQVLTPITPTPGANFGNAVALFGNTVLVGAEHQNMAYVFVRGGTTWTQQARMSVGFGTSDNFGASVALSGNTALIGATGQAGNTGAAYVFVRSSTGWSQQQEITATDGMPGDYFGAVALSGNTALIGASNKNGGTGAAYVFVRSGTTWTQTQEITAADGGPNAFFGVVATNGPLAVIGAPGKGAVYVYVRSGSGITTTWTLQAEVPSPNTGSYADFFGDSVALSGTTMLVGAPDVSMPFLRDAGAAYVYVLNGGVWSQQAELTGALFQNSYLGFAVGLSGDTALLGAYNQQGTGAAYVFVRN